MRRLLFALTGLLSMAGSAAAEPELHGIFPLGATRGTSVEVTLRGKALNEPQAIVCSHSGITAESIDKDRMRVTVADDVSPGDYDIWVFTSDGLSNPRRFSVSEFSEVVAQEKRDSPQAAQEVPVPAVVNAQLARAADLDWYRFEGRQGQAVTVHCRSQSLDGMVEPIVALVGPQGRELLHSQGDELEPRLHAVLPKTGTYYVRVADRAYQSNARSMYRLTISTEPELVAAFPHVLTRGKSQAVTLYGYGLPGGVSAEPSSASGLQQIEAEIEVPAEGDADGGGWTVSSAAMLDGFSYRHAGVNGAVRFWLTDADPPVVETEESNSSPETAQPLELPADVAGRFLTARDRDWYGFAAKKGEKLSIEAFGERLGQPMDLDVAVYDATGKLLETLKDVAEPKDAAPRFPLASLDVAGLWTVPADGEYRLVVRDLYGISIAGPQRVYRLLVGPPAPDFRVSALHPNEKTPRGLACPPGGKIELQLIAIRTGGFEGPIRVSARNLPSGLTAEETVIPAKKTTAVLTLTASDETEAGTGLLDLAAEAEIDGDAMERQVRGATLVSSDTPLVTRLTAGIAFAVIEGGEDDEKK